MSSAIASSPINLPTIVRRTRAYFAPVNRTLGVPTIFDPSISHTWSLEAPAYPWIDLGWIDGLKRISDTKIVEVNTGAPASVRLQTWQSLGAIVSFRFATWSKLSMALASGSQHMNILLPDSSATPTGSGAKAKPATMLQQGSSASVLYVNAAQGPIVRAGDLIVVDEDTDSKTGFVGSAISGAYLPSSKRYAFDTDYIRRVSFNVGRVISSTSDGEIRLATPMLAGKPGSAMKMQQLVGFVDREGGTFFQEWSALFVREGVQGERMFTHYPRLQVCQPQVEVATPLAPQVEQISLEASFRALAVIDPNDGEQVLCYRSFIPSSIACV